MTPNEACAEEKSSLTSLLALGSSCIGCSAVWILDASLNSIPGSSRASFLRSDLLKAQTKVCNWLRPCFQRSGAGFSEKYIFPDLSSSGVVDQKRYSWSARLRMSNFASLVGCLPLRSLPIMTLFISTLIFVKASTDKVWSLNISSVFCKEDPQSNRNRLNSPFWCFKRRSIS